MIEKSIKSVKTKLAELNIEIPTGVKKLEDLFALLPADAQALFEGGETLLDQEEDDKTEDVTTPDKTALGLVSVTDSPAKQARARLIVRYSKESPKKYAIKKAALLAELKAMK